MDDWGIPGSVVIFIIILSTGLIGGIRNWIAEDIENDRTCPRIIRRILDAVIASAAVPLFLSVIGNEKISPIFGEIRPWDAEYQKALFILIGFCALASFLSQRFLDSLSNKVMQLSDEVRDVKTQVEQAIVISDLQVEPEVPESRFIPENYDTPIVSDTEAKVLGAITFGQFLVRSTGGLASDTGISIVELAPTLDRLQSQGWARRIETGKGERWGATEQGRALIARLRTDKAPR